MKIHYKILIFTSFFIASCSTSMLDDFDYFENDIASYYVPKGYVDIKINDSVWVSYGTHPYLIKVLYRPIPFNDLVYIVYEYPDGSIFTIGRDDYADSKVTADCCDTIFSLESNSKILTFRRSPNFHLPVYEHSGKNFDLEESGQIATDSYYSVKNNTYSKQIIYEASNYWFSYFITSYSCKNQADSVKFNNAMESIVWKKNNQDLIYNRKKRRANLNN